MILKSFWGSFFGDTLWTTYLGFFKTNDHRPTNYRPTHSLPLTHRPPTTFSPTYVKTEDQILNMFCIL